MFAFIICIMFLFFFGLVIVALPTQCHDHDSYWYSSCHSARYYGINCVPYDTCVYQGYSNPGPAGFGIIVIFLIAFIMCFACDPITTYTNTNQRKKRDFSTKNEYLNL